MFVILLHHTSIVIKTWSETPSRHALEAFLHGTDRLQTEVLRIQRLPIAEDAKPGWDGKWIKMDISGESDVSEK